MFKVIETPKEDQITRIVKREQDVLADQYDELKAKVCDLIDEQKNYHLNRLAILAKVVRSIEDE